MSVRLVLCICILGGELWSLFLSLLAARQRKRSLPEEVRDIYDAKSWNLYLGICREEFRLNCVRALFARGIDVVLIFSPFFSWVDGLARDNYLFGLLLPMVMLFLINLPVKYLASLYDEFEIQKRYGQSNHTLASFNADYFVSEVSSFALSMVAGSVLVFAARTVINAVTRAGGGHADAFEATRMVLPLLVATAVLISLCALGIELAVYKFRPMPQGEVRAAVERMLSSCKKKVRWLTIYNESAKSIESNAFCLNIPGFRMISIADNAVDGDRPRETLATIAHEVGHIKHRFAPSDALRFLPGIALGVAAVALLRNAAALLSVDMWIRESFCLNYTSAFIWVQFLGIVLAPVNLLLDIPRNYASRQNEYEADRNAVLEGYGPELAKTLKEDYRRELMGVNTHPLIEILEFSHPALPKRLRAIYKAMEEMPRNAV